MPGGLLLALVVALVNSPLFVLVVPSLPFYYTAVFVAGLLLAWRFNSSRVVFSLLVLLLAHRAIDFFAAGQLSGPIHGGPGRMAVTLSALLIPLNFVAFAATRERGLSVVGVLPRSVLVFLESVVFAVLCRPENSPGNLKTSNGSVLPMWVWLSFAATAAVLGWRFFKTRKPIEPGFAWCVAAVFLWLEFAPVGKMSDAYVATAALILGTSLIETSYVLAYHDELTGIRGRRAFNESLLSLDQQYAIAIVDIDHFKKFNDTYGHDVGDQVLCMVAARLAQVEGNGQAFRCGGEEFAIVFRNLSAKEAFEHLDALRRVIEKSTFQLRAGDRRAEDQVEKVNERRAGESDRRRPGKKKGAAAISKPSSDRLSVTVSIGVAEPSTRNRQPERVIQAADQALYRAKEKGRNRVELASMRTPRIAERKVAKSARS